MLRGTLNRPASVALTLTFRGAGVVMFILLTFVVRIILAPSLALMFFAALYSSFWVPQIVRAAQRGRTCALDRTYLVGTTIGRLLVAMCEYQHALLFLFFVASALTLL